VPIAVRGFILNHKVNGRIGKNRSSLAGRKQIFVSGWFVPRAGSRSARYRIFLPVAALNRWLITATGSKVPSADTEEVSPRHGTWSKQQKWLFIVIGIKEDN
jgi:hypothetical protein